MGVQAQHLRKAEQRATASLSPHSLRLLSDKERDRMLVHLSRAVLGMRTRIKELEDLVTDLLEERATKTFNETGGADAG